jgi:hypothetical protein
MAFSYYSSHRGNGLQYLYSEFCGQAAATPKAIDNDWLHVSLQPEPGRALLFAAASTVAVHHCWARHCVVR